MIKKFLRSVVLAVLSVVRRNSSPKVIFYHDIGLKYTPMGTEIGLLVSHMRLLRTGDVICFDDGFHGLYDHIGRLLEIVDLKKNRVLVFLAVRLIGTPGYLSWAEILKLRGLGVVFQNHGWQHQSLVGPVVDESPIEERDEAWYHRELIESKSVLEKHLRERVEEFCFPVGYFSDELVERCRQAGYTRVYASFPGSVSNSFIQPRCLVQNMSPFEMRCVLNGGMNPLAGRYYRMHHTV